MYRLLGNKYLVTTLLYRGSIHGWKFKDFHSRCDYKGPTISLFRVKDGDCIGGYTKASWSSDLVGKSFGENDAMLFNLSKCRHFPSKKNATHIYNSSEYGPCFSGGSNELCAALQPFNGEGNCRSYAN